MNFAEKFLRFGLLQLLFIILFTSSVSATTFADDFNDGNLDGWWVGYSPYPSGYGNWRIENGVLIEDQQGDLYGALVENLSLSSFNVQADMFTNDPAGYGGFMVWYVDKQNFAVVRLYPTGGGIWFSEIINGVETATIFPISINYRIWHSFKVTVDASSGITQVYLDDINVTSHTFTFPNRLGLTGLISGNSGALFDNFSIISEEDPLAVGIELQGKNNKVNLKEKQIEVTILSSSDFDAPSQVDKTTLTFGKTGDERSLLRCERKGKDINRDRLKDLSCTFLVKKTGLACGDSEVTLKGKLVETDDLFEEKQSILLKPCK